MQPLEEKDSSPLEDTEITRLIKVSRELGYKKQDKIPERNLVDFKPTSITQIATSSDNEKQESIDRKEDADKSRPAQINDVIKDQEPIDNNSTANPLDLDPDDTEVDTQSITEQKEINESLDDPLSTRSAIAESSSLSDKVVEEDISKNQGSEVNSGQDGLPKEELLEEAPTVPIKHNAASEEQAKPSGIEIDDKTAITDLENTQREALETFQTIIDNIKTKEAVDKTDLTQSILKVVTRLASERAGEIIDEHPETFKKKIVSFADKIKQASENLILNLNPVDANLLKKTLSGFLSDQKVEIKENAELLRGDFMFQMGAVEIGNLISDQISIVEKKKKATTPEKTTKKDNKKIEKKEVEQDDKKAPQEIELDTNLEIDNDKK